LQKFTHLDADGHVRMVDVSDKKPTLRTAKAQGVVFMNPATFEAIENQSIKKGNVLETSRIAAIFAAKKTSDLIPLCHPLNITHIQVDFSPDKPSSSIQIVASVQVVDQTGAEMEALAAVSVAALTIYDMCKSYDREMRFSDICLLEKSGGKSGTFKRTGHLPDVS
jgi:cyclic pyranopterin phosphate synthase